MVANFIEKSQKMLTGQQTSIMSAAALISGLSVASAVLGIVNKRLLVGGFAGDAAPQVAAFLAAFRIPDFLFQLMIAGVLSATFIPVYTRILEEKEGDTQRFVSVLMTILSVVFVAIAILVGIFAHPIIRAITGPAFTDSQVDLAAMMMRYLLVAQFFFLLSNFLSGILQVHRNFLLPALSPIMYNLGIIGGILFLSGPFGILGPCFGAVIGAFVHFIIQLPLAIKCGFRYRPDIRLDKSAPAREVLRLMGPRGVTQSTNAAEDFVSTYIATSFSATHLTLVTYAYALVAAPVRFIGVSIAQAALPFLSSEAKKHDMQSFTLLLMKTLHQIAFFMLPAAALFLVLRIPIVRIAYGARELLWRDTVLLGRLVAIYAIAIAAHAMIHVVLRAFYALKETRLPFYVASLGMILNVFIMWVGAYVLGWGIMAVAIGPTIAAIAELLLLLFLLFRRIGFFSPQEFFIPQLKMILATLAMGISLYFPMKYLDQLVFDTTRVLGLLALTSTASLAGFIVYLVFSKLLQVEQLSILGSIQGKLRNWKTRLSGTTEVIATNESTDL